ncbi:MAG: DUF2029 domain-containing protein [Acidimicrobiaceae bacterium]|nr:DUF2029 domain-containing protein [Acidimicrobiaceae bacterium]
MPDAWLATPHVPDVENGAGGSQRNHAGGGRTRARGQSARVVAAVVAVYVLVLIAGLAIGRHVTLPNAPLDTAGGGINTVVRTLLGYGDRSDFLVDFASAHALIHGGNAYAISAQLIHGVGPAWNLIQVADPHPPTLLTLVLPTTVLSYHVALAAWQLAMIFALIWTLYLVGVRPVYAIPLGVAIAITIPGNYGIINPVPIIGLGVAMAYRWRDNPVLAGLGVALAAAPKESGLLLAVVFLLAGRIRTVAWSGVWYGLAAVIPLAFNIHVWSHYFSAGIHAIGTQANRRDDASLLLLGRSHGVPTVVTLLIIGALAVCVAIARRDLFWPVVWVMVAALPIAWNYSQLTFLPLMAWAVVRGGRRSTVLAVLAGGLAMAAAPNAFWTKATFPLVTAIVLVLLLTARRDREGELWLPRQYDPFVSWPQLGGRRSRQSARV